MIKDAYKNNEIIPRWLQSLRRVIPIVQALSSRKDSVHLEAFIKLIEHSLRHKGCSGTIKDFKSMRTYLQQLVCGQIPDPLKFRKVLKCGFPKVLKPWKDLVDGNIDDHRYLLSIWRMIEMLRINPDRSTSTITDEFTGSKELISKICRWLDTWDGFQALPKSLPDANIILSNKAGPNGPATAFAFQDLEALRADKKLYAAVNTLVKRRGINLGQYPTTPGTYRHSKVVFLSDKACKTRVVAIGDYWSNVALSSLHQAFMQGLRRLKADVTYRQGEIPNLIKGLGPRLYSSDMTAFTDRFPREIEVAIVSKAYGEEIGVLWNTIIADREFDTGRETKIRYSVGNPMGFLSSWAISTFTHHAVKQYCASVSNYNKRYKYLILGDDCLDTDRNVYDTYINTIQELGVSISRNKCTQSEQGFTEFAKRIFTPSGEATGLPIDLLEGISRMPEQFIELVRIMRNRGYHDLAITSGVQALLPYLPKKVSKVILFVLSSPESILGMPPLVRAEGNYLLIDPPLLNSGLSGTSLDPFVAQARLEIFWEEVERLFQLSIDHTKPSTPKQGERMHIPEYHPALSKIGDLLEIYLQNESNEYSIYEEWMSGKSFELALVPTIDQYRYRNKSHKAARSRYKVITRTRALALGLVKPRTTFPDKISNFELFQKGFPQD